MSNLTILNTPIRQIDNLFSLNELHKVSGNEDKHRPAFFIRLDTTKDLVAEIQKQDPNNQAILSKNGIGTYACMEIALAYAAWIDPKFHLVVLRAYMAMKGNSQKIERITPLALPEKPRKIQGTTRAAEGEYLYTREFSALEIDQLADLWDVAEQQYNFILSLIPLFESMQSEHWLKKLSIAKSAFETPHMSYPVLAGICEDIEEYTGMSPSIRLKKRMERRFSRF